MPAEPYMVKTFSPSLVLLCCRRPSDSNSSAQRWAEEFSSLLKVIGGALCFSLYLLWVSRNSCLSFPSSYNRKWKYFNAKKQGILRIDSTFLFCLWKVFPECVHLLTGHCSSMLKSNKKSQQFILLDKNTLKTYYWIIHEIHLKLFFFLKYSAKKKHK